MRSLGGCGVVFFPAGNGAIANGILTELDSPDKAMIALCPATRLGIDTSGPTLGNDQRLLVLQIIQPLLDAGGRIILLSALPIEERRDGLARLAKSGYPTETVRFLPGPEEANQSCPHRNQLGWYKSFLWHRVRIAQEESLTHYVDADSAVRELFRKFVPDVVFRYPWELGIRNANHTVLTPAEPLITRTGAQGMTQEIEIDRSTHPPTYRVV